MAEKTEAKLSFWKSPMFWGVGATVAILLLAVVLGASETCPSGFSGNGSCPTKWTLFLASTPNEVGDALAGFAGALAFVWIIVTVAMQSIELREQREVLTLQKDEMEMQREATEKMAQAMAAQAEIFEDEQRGRVEERARKKLEQQLSWITQLSEGEKGSDRHWRIQDGNGRSDLGLFYENSVLGHIGKNSVGSIDDQILRVANNSTKSIQQLDEMKAKGFVVFQPNDPSLYRALLGSIQEIDSIIEELSEDQKLRLRNIRLRKLESNLRLVIARDDWFDNFPLEEPEHET